MDIRYLPWKITGIKKVVFGHQKDNKKDGLQMDSIWISDTCLERSQECNGYILDTKRIIRKMDYNYPKIIHILSKFAIESKWTRKGCQLSKSNLVIVQNCVESMICAFLALKIILPKLVITAWCPGKYQSNYSFSAL